MKNKKLKKVTISLVMGLTLVTTLGPSVTAMVKAHGVKQEQKSSQKTEPKFPTPTGKEVLSSDVKLSDIILIDGVAYDSKGNIVVDYYRESLQRGKLSWVTKAIKNGYNKLPASVRNTINRYAGINTILGFIDHFTGTVVGHVKKSVCLLVLHGQSQRLLLYSVYEIKKIYASIILICAITNVIFLIMDIFITKTIDFKKLIVGLVLTPIAIGTSIETIKK